MKRVILLVVSVLCVFSLAACNDDEQSSTTGKEELLVFYPALTDDDGEVLRAWKIAAEKCNIVLKAQVGNTVEYSQIDQLIAGKQFPDMLSIQQATDMQRYIENDFLLAIDDLIEEHAPNISKYLKDYPDFKKQITWTDGKIYHLPTINIDMPKTQKTIVARKDWMDLYRTAKSKAIDWAPTTPTEMTDLLMYWYNNISPMQNGVAITDKIVPYFDRKGGRTEQNFDNILCLLGAHYLMYEEDGIIKFAGSQPEFKAALVELAKWWQGGLIDTNFFDKSAAKTARENYWTNTDKGGMTMDYATGTFTYIDAGKKNNPAFDLEVLTPMGGFLSTTDAPLFCKGGQALTTKATKAEQIAAIKFFDYLWSDEGQILTRWGIEGETYEVKDGVYSLINNYNKDTLRALGIRNPDIPTITTDNDQYENGMPENLQKAIKKSDAYVGILDESVFFRSGVQTYLTSKQADTYSANITAIRTAVDKYIQSVMQGSKNTTSDYDAFLTEVERLKLTETIALAQAAYSKLSIQHGLS